MGTCQRTWEGAGLMSALWALCRATRRAALQSNKHHCACTVVVCSSVCLQPGHTTAAGAADRGEIKRMLSVFNENVPSVCFKCTRIEASMKIAAGRPLTGFYCYLFDISYSVMKLFAIPNRINNSSRSLDTECRVILSIYDCFSNHHTSSDDSHPLRSHILQIRIVELYF